MELKVVDARDGFEDFVVELAYRVFGDEGRWVEIGLGWSPRWARTLVLLVDGKPVGFNQVYVWPCCDIILGVHHYAALLPEYRGKGLGKVLIASGEEMLAQLGAEVYAATLSGKNIASRRMLEEMGYSLLTWEQFESQTCYDALDEVLYVTGGYTDDLVALKDSRCPPRNPFEVIKASCCQT